MTSLVRAGALLSSIVAFSIVAAGTPFQAAGPQMTVESNLGVRVFAAGFVTPTSIAFPAASEVFVLEKNTGKVLRIVNGKLHSTVLDLAVNNNSERGLLGIALHPDFPANPGVYLYWTCRTAGPPADPFVQTERECDEALRFGPDSDQVLEVPLLGNRVDRFVWDAVAGTLMFDRPITSLRAFQNDGAPTPEGQGDEAQPARGNHDGGVVAFGSDRKLYVIIGDVGRRGQLQNLPSGPTPTGLGTPVPDDQFGGPEPDDLHFTGVILRLNDDGSTPTDNPFFAAGTAIGGETGANIRQIFVYGIRNSFGMAVDPIGGSLWYQDNGEDAFDELCRAEPGMNSGWIQIAGPVARIGEYRQIETTSLHHEDFPNLQQLRWGPERIATTPGEALSRLFMIPGAHYKDPEFSWKHVLAPAAIGFVNGAGLGPQYRGDLFVGLSVPEPEGGALFRLKLTGNRRRIAVDDPRLEDRVVDNLTFHDLTESETLLIGRNFGVVTDIETAPNGNLLVVSLLDGTIYEIFRMQ